MTDDFLTRAWADNHSDFATDLSAAARAIMEAFRALHDRQYAAPWRDAITESPCTGSCA